MFARTMRRELAIVLLLATSLAAVVATNADASRADGANSTETTAPDRGDPFGCYWASEDVTRLFHYEIAADTQLSSQSAQELAVKISSRMEPGRCSSSLRFCSLQLNPN